MVPSPASKSCPVCRTQVTMVTRIPVDTPIGAAVHPRHSTRMRDNVEAHSSTQVPDESSGTVLQLNGCRWQTLNSRDASNFLL